MKLAELVGIARPLEVTRHGLVQRLAVPPGVPGPEALATIKIVCDAPKNSEAVGSSNANSLCGGEFGWITGNLCDLSKGYFATTFLSSSPPTPATQSGLFGAFIPFTGFASSAVRFNGRARRAERAD